MALISGIIGLQMGSVWGRLGFNVTVVEFLSIGGADIDEEMRAPLLSFNSLCSYLLTRNG